MVEMKIDRDLRLDTPSNLNELYERDSHALTRFAASLVGASEAADIVQDVIEKMITNGRLSDAENPRALMYSAVLARARTVQRSAFRRRHREQRFVQGIVSADPEVMPEVARAVARLGPQQRACIFLTYWEDMTPSQISERLAIAEGTVKHHLARARKHLREVLDD